MKFLLNLLIVCFSSSLLLNAQSIERQVISGSGASYTAGNISIDQTVGEAVISTASNSNIIITQGFHQPENSVTISIPETDRMVDLKVYPNPTNDQIFLNITKVEAESLKLRMIDLNGKMLLNKANISPIGNIQTLDMSAFAAGTYFLLIYDEEGSAVEQFKIELLKN